MGEESDVVMSGQGTAVETASNSPVVSNSEERAAKRIKVDVSANAKKENSGEDAVLGEVSNAAPIELQAEIHASKSAKDETEQATQPAKKSTDHRDNRDADGRVKGLAPVKKE